jgi:hypothetical protein
MPALKPFLRTQSSVELLSRVLGSAGASAA